MICKYCFAELEDGTAVCPICGKELEAPVEETVQEEVVETVEDVPAEETLVEEAPVEETFVTGEEVLGERAYQETQERLEAEAAAPVAEEPVIFPEPEAEPEVVETEPEEAPAEAPEEPAPAPVDEDDDDGFGDIDKYLDGNGYEDLNEGNKYFK